MSRNVITCMVVMSGLVLLFCVLIGKSLTAVRGGQTPRAACLSHQRQLAIAVATYLQDNAAQFPAQWIGLHAAFPGVPVAALACPAKRQADAAAPAIGYGFNGLLVGAKAEIAAGKERQTIVTADAVTPDALLRTRRDVDVTRHGLGGGFVAAYLDGHAAFIKAEEIFELDPAKLTPHAAR